jgi:hypothetical protein
MALGIGGMWEQHVYAVGIDSDGTLDANIDTNTSHRLG